jgi:hypothetical protein
MPFIDPPIRSNDRLHWAEKAKITRWVREAARMVAAGYEPVTHPVTVTLIWEVTNRHRRDVGASAGTLKAWIDGMVDAGYLVRGDGHESVVEERLRIEVGTRRGVRVEIEEVSVDAGVG